MDDPVVSCDKAAHEPETSDRIRIEREKISILQQESAREGQGAFSAGRSEKRRKAVEMSHASRLGMETNLQGLTDAPLKSLDGRTLNARR
jgi:hypothetical protein